MLKVALLLRHIHQENLYDPIRRHGRVLHELYNLPVSTDHREALTHSIQISLG
jgi:hypothetical protein